MWKVEPLIANTLAPDPAEVESPPAPLVGVFGLWSIMCNPVSSVPCILCTLFWISRLPVSVSGPLESGSEILDCLLIRPGTGRLPPTRLGVRFWDDPRITVKIHQISGQSPGQVMKTGPKATQNHEKRTLESWEIKFLRKLMFAILPLPNACFSNFRHPDSESKITWRQAWPITFL